MDNAISRKKIAELAGVSKTTVTRVLSESNAVSAKTKERVMEVINSLGYTQNKLARNVGSNRNSNFVAVLVPDMTNYYYLEIFGKIVNSLENLDYTISIYKVHHSNFSQVYDKIIENRVSAIINLAFIPISETYLKKIKSAKIKVVHPGIGYDPVRINIDYTNAMTQVFNLLRTEGRKSFRFLCGASKSFLADGRLQCYVKLVDAAGLGPGEDSIIWGNYPAIDAMSEGYNITYSLMCSEPHIDALFCFNDMMAIGAFKAIKDVGKVVGKDIAVVGFDNIKLGNFLTPSLSTIDTDIEQETDYYVNYILGNDIKEYKIASNFIQRDSTAKY